MNKKHIVIKILFVAVLLITFIFNNQIEINAASYDIPGGSMVFDFQDADDLNAFNVYSAFSPLPKIVDGKVQFYNLAEQKLILNSSEFSNLDMSADFIEMYKSAAYGSGFYIHASNPGHGL